MNNVISLQNVIQKGNQKQGFVLSKYKKNFTLNYIETIDCITKLSKSIKIDFITFNLMVEQLDFLIEENQKMQFQSTNSNRNIIFNIKNNNIEIIYTKKAETIINISISRELFKILQKTLIMMNNSLNL